MSHGQKSKNIKYGTVEIDKEQDINNKSYYKAKKGWGTRHTFVLMCFLGNAGNFLIRVNISVAIVAMVKSPSSLSGSNNQSLIGDQCPFPEPVETQNDVFNTGDFEWDATQQGLILSSFFYGFCLTQFPGGLMAEKFGGKWVYGMGSAGGYLMTLFNPIAAYRGGYGALIAVRILQGLFQGVTFPAIYTMMSLWSPVSERPVAISLIWAAGQVGTVVAMLLSGYLSDSLGWPSVFYIFGGYGLIWFILYAFLCYDSPDRHPRISESELLYIKHNLNEDTQIIVDDDCGETTVGKKKTNKKFPPLKKMFTSAPVYAICLAQIGSAFGFYTILTEIPTYLNNILHYPIATNGYLSALPYFLMAVSSIIISLLADKLIKSGWISYNVVRKGLTTVALSGPAVGLIGLSFTGCNQTAVIAWLCVTVTLSGAAYASFLINHVELTPNYAGTLMGIGNTLANLSGILAPLIASAFTAQSQSIESWRNVFRLAAGVYLVTNIVVLIFGKTAVQRWNYHEDD